MMIFNELFQYAFILYAVIAALIAVRLSNNIFKNIDSYQDPLVRVVARIFTALIGAIVAGFLVAILPVLIFFGGRWETSGWIGLLLIGSGILTSIMYLCVTIILGYIHTHNVSKK